MKKLKAWIITKDGKPQLGRDGQLLIFPKDTGVRFESVAEWLSLESAECEIIIKEK